jgi:2-keto-3-deoxy-L-rhamnonate aldolase RhmA
MENRFKRWLAEPRIPLGTWLMSAAPSTAEALGHIGFDFLVVDMEHVTIEFAELAHILRAIAATPAEPVVRLAWNDPILIKRALDAGSRTVMLPFVQSAEEARTAVAAAKYPPEGTRGVAAVHRASRYGADGDYLKRANGETCVIVQLETPAAVERLAEIAAVPGVDSLFVGPGDMAAAMGRIGEIAHPEVQAMLERAAQAARAAGKPVGIVGPNPEMVRRFQSYGYTWTAVGSDIALMTARARECLSALRDGPAAPEISPSEAIAY